MLDKAKIAVIPILILFLIGNAYPGDPLKKKFTSKQLNDLMAQVLKKCEIDMQNLSNYIFNETEIYDVSGDLKQNAKSFRREFVWVVRDGYFVRSPLSYDGKEVTEDEKVNGEKDYIQYQKRQKKWKNSIDQFVDFFRYTIKSIIQNSWGPLLNSKLVPLEEMSYQDSYLEFKPKKFQYMGEVQYEGKTLIQVRTEYGEIWQKVVMLIDPDEGQLIKLTNYRDVGIWGTVESTMAMHKPFGDVWLPKRFSHNRIATVAIKAITSYSREFHSFRRSEVKARFWFNVDEKENEPGSKK
jgi:hypothetical protein